MSSLEHAQSAPVEHTVEKPMEEKAYTVIADILVRQSYQLVNEDANMHELMGYASEHLTNEKLLEDIDRTIRAMTADERSQFGGLDDSAVREVFIATIEKNAPIIRNRFKNLTNTERNKKNGIE